MTNMNVLIIYGGGGPEHEISLISARFIRQSLQKFDDLTPIMVQISKDGSWRNEEGHLVEINSCRELICENSRKVPIDVAIPCLHGWPGETGDIQSYFDLIGIRYIGSGPWASMTCFDKIDTKLWMNALDIPHTPYIFAISTQTELLERARKFLKQHGKVFIKPSAAGSSVGCTPVENVNELQDAIDEAFKHDKKILIEKCLTGRELEIAVYEYRSKLNVSNPGEIVCPQGFYSYMEKYNDDSRTKTVTSAENLDFKIVAEMKSHAKKLFLDLNLKHLARVDFFLTDRGDLYVNEINTFPGLTPISMFPKMMEAQGVSFSDYLYDILEEES
jgi:D-alanine-D-alanine ligase